MAKQQEDLPFRYLASSHRKYQDIFSPSSDKGIMKTTFGFSSYNTGTGYKKASEYIIWTQDKNMNVFTSASPYGLTFLFLNSYLVKLGLFFLNLFLSEKDTFQCSLLRRLPPSRLLTSSLTFSNALPSTPMPNSIWKLGPALLAATHIRNRFTAASARCLGMGGVVWKNNRDFQSWRLLVRFSLPKTLNSKASRLQILQRLSW